MKVLTVYFLLTVASVVHCQTMQDVVILMLEELSEKQLDVLKGYDEMMERINDIQMKLEILEGQQDLKSFVQKQIEEVVSLPLIDECAEGDHNCGTHAKCRDTLHSFKCICPPGLAWNDTALVCEDIDECAQNLHKCDANAECRNTHGHYSCQCKSSYEGDGYSCEFKCRSPAKVIEGLGCVVHVEAEKSFQEMKNHCEQNLNGWRLLENFGVEHVPLIKEAFPSTYGWVGVYDGKWLTSEAAVEKDDLWREPYETDPTRRCGKFGWLYTSSPGLVQRDCSGLKQGAFCQFKF